MSFVFPGPQLRGTGATRRFACGFPIPKKSLHCKTQRPSFLQVAFPNH